MTDSTASETWFGRGFGRLTAYLTASGSRRVGVLTTPARRFADDLTAALAGFEVTLFDQAQVHVPVEIVEAATAQLAGVDTVIALGGGSAIGLGKALRLRQELRFVAVPTTYAGSEMTSMYGVTTGHDKQTGRDPRVRPDLVVYDVDLTRGLPIAVTVQSLHNAIAHVISVLSTGSLDPRSGVFRSLALGGVATVIRSIEDLLLAPRSLVARDHAQRGASACAAAYEDGKPGVQHSLAHLLGGALRVDHAPLHAILLPQFVAHLRATQPAMVDELETAIWPGDNTSHPDLESYLHDTLVRAGAPVALTALASDALPVAKIPDAVTTALVEKPDLPPAIARDALHGLRPPGRFGTLDLGSEPHAVVVGCPIGRAKTIVLALHGRGAEAGTIARRYFEIAGHDPHVAVVGLRAEFGAPRWYEVRYGQAGAGTDPEVLHAIARVETALASLARMASRAHTQDERASKPPLLPTTSIFLAGFSQGACLALEVAARTTTRLAGVIAPAAARVGQPADWAPRTGLAGLRVAVGAAADDKWIARADLDATIEWFRDAGAQVEDLSGPGDRHEITLRQRMRARELLLGAVPLAATGFGNALTSEAIPDAVPPAQSSPRLPAHGLYPEQINGTGFTAERATNQRTWMYRVRPSAQRRATQPLPHDRLVGTFDGPPAGDLFALPPVRFPIEGRDFVDGLHTVCGAGSAALRRGYAFHIYAANRSMELRAFCNSDGDLLIIPEHGAIAIVTELGRLDVRPGSIAVIPRGIVFSVLLFDQRPVRGYVAEPFGRHFRLPERGPIGANGLADPRHFRTAHAWYESRLAADTRIVAKLGGRLHEAAQDHSPFDVAGWHGNYLPWSYDLDLFCPSSNARFDHGDPSVYSVLTAPLDEQGANTLDFVVFPPRVDATAHTFRPPFFHRNVVSEINGIVRQHAPAGSPFVPGCTFVTPCLVPHGVSGRAIEHSRTMTDVNADQPSLFGTELWFQLESVLPPVMTTWAAGASVADWPSTWGSHRSYFR